MSGTTYIATICKCIITILLAAALFGCGNSSLLLQHGIGDSAYPAETDTRFRDSKTYFLHMCQRANRCSGSNGTIDPTAWEDVTYAALNDIDERCGAYLRSLDDARRNRLAWNSMWNNVGTPGKAIIAQTNPGVKALTIVSELFDFAQASGNEFYSAVILSEEPSVIERVVRKLQTQYRVGLDGKLNDKQAFQTIERSGAHYIVRGYLRLCLPLTIESELQSFKTNAYYTGAGQRAALLRDAAVLKVLDGLPMVDRDSSSPHNPVKPKPSKPANQNGNGIPDHTPTDKPLTQDQLMIQRANLCLPSRAIPTETPKLSDPDYVNAVEEFKRGYFSHMAPRSVPIPDASRTVQLINDIGPCAGTAFKGAYERVAFQNSRKAAELHALLFVAAQKFAPGEVFPQNFATQTTFNDDTRRAIMIFRSKRMNDDGKVIDSLTHANLISLNLQQPGQR
ncbi:MAG: hypothetical protein ABL901_05345 [Hyphomicrobiaceae bacterium]